MTLESTLIDQINERIGIFYQERRRFPQHDEIAEAIDVNPRTLRRHLRSIGTSYRKILDKRRIRFAKKMLLSTESRIEEIASQMGFISIGGFIKAFKRWTGITPYQYRYNNSSGWHIPSASAA